MKIGAHLPLIDFGDGLLSLDELRSYAAAAADCGYVTLSANDHLVWQRPWLDGPTTLTSVVADAGDMALATSISLPTVRHPIVLAKWLATVGCLTDNRIIAGLGPGSSSADYAAVGVPFEDRWARFDAAFRVVKAAVRGNPLPSTAFYDLEDLRLDPVPATPPEVWFGSWGSDRRLRSMAEVADGWMASAYNTTPRRFAEALQRLHGHLDASGRDPARFPNLIATMWLCMTESQDEADRVIRERLAPILRRDPAELAEQLPIGSPEHCIDLLQAYDDAGAHQVLLWPLRDPRHQLELFDELVAPTFRGVEAVSQ